MSQDPIQEESPEAAFAKGITFGLGAYLWWGLVLPVYIKSLRHVNVVELLGHRVIWSLVMTALLIAFLGGWNRLRVALRVRRTRLLLLASTIAITGNWLGFLWAVYTDRLSHASLGYYINPLISVLLGFLFFSERLRRKQQVALVLAALGVLYMTLRLGELPWISLFLAFSFGFYGLLRKMALVDSVGGLAVETALITPVLLLVMGFLETQDGLAIFHGSAMTILALPFAGIVTAVPLILFAGAARRLPLSAIGFMQYITPTLQLITAVALFGEPFTGHHAVAFAAIWTALAFYTYDMVQHRRRQRAG